MKKREQLIAKATELFCRNGFKITGIDTVIEQAGVAKMTLYSHFSSKDELIRSCLEALDHKVFEHFSKTLAQAGNTPKEQLRQLFRVLKEQLESPEFNGCPFMRATLEFADDHTGVRQIVRQHKQKFLQLFTELATNAGITKPNVFAQQLQLLFEGVLTQRQLSGSSESCDTAQVMLQLLLDKTLEKK